MMFKESKKVAGKWYYDNVLTNFEPVNGVFIIGGVRSDIMNGILESYKTTLPEDKADKCSFEFLLTSAWMSGVLPRDYELALQQYVGA